MRVLASLCAIGVIAGCGDSSGDTTDATATAATTDAATTTSTGEAPTTGSPTTAASTTGEPATSTSTTGEPVEPPETVPLSATDHLIRISMALRGTRPSLAELTQVAEDPATLPAIVDAYLESELFAQTVKDMYAEALLMRAQLGQSMLPYAGPLLGLDDATYLASVPEEPLELIAAVVRDPLRSFTEIVTTDEVYVNQVGAAAWHVAGYDPDAPEAWQMVHYDDERPQGGGVLASSALWHRHRANGNNYQRVRANLVARVFLCEDFLTRDLPPFPPVDFSDVEALQNALQSNPGCVSCHQTLDPLASYFWGAQSRGRAGIAQAYDPMTGECLAGKEHLCFPTEEYVKTQETAWKKTTGRAPGYYGAPTPDGHLDTLGEHVAADPRFSQCAARRFYSYMAQVDLEAVPFALVDELDAAFHVEDRLDVRALARAIVLSDEFRASHAETPAEADAVVGLKVARPEQLERLFADLTGFRWIGMRQPGDVHGEFPLLNSDGWGYRAMAGGIDGYSITQPTWTFNPTRTLVVQALASEAAGYVVDRDFATAEKANRKLLGLVDEDAETAAVRAQIAELHARVLGELVAPDSAEVDESFALWSAVSGVARQRWKILLTAMFQDNRVVFF
ncbi:hypothetical protein OV079_09650 [Nannocystis pusilla]|uniref:DUF1549 domain-containing protein n=1 Tax=Nannocystis pusilla TaxID=889268 RepID=A0A9X3ELA9_9BACT|nr:hypothetical protein [Nannocystis pusilla]MCY1005825.1 hypothetical protein [Nannocystis pusilla]